MSLRTRIALVVGVTVLLASAIGGIGTVVSSRTVGRDRVDQALQADLDLFIVTDSRLPAQLQFAFDIRRVACEENLAEAAELDVPDRPPPPRPTRFRFQPEFASTMQLLAMDGTPFAACQDLPVDDVDLDIAAQGSGVLFRTVTIDNQRHRIVTNGFENIGAVQFARSLEITDDTLRSLLFRTGGFALLGALLASALGWLFASRATKPVRQLSETAERVAATQDLGEQIDATGQGEIGTLATSFNTMLASLATMRDQQERLVQDAGHELRTPLTSIRTNVELLQRHRDMDPEVRQEILGDIGSELSELTELTSEVIDSAAQVPASMDGHEELLLIELTERAGDRARRRHRRNVVVFLTGHPEQTAVMGDSSMLTRAITNLINNAIKFSEGKIDVVVSQTSVTVRDQGPGIPPDDLEHIFDRFYRATTSRSAPGSGLGLAIVKSVIEGHGGTVMARNQPGGGAEVGFELPQLARADTATELGTTTELD